MNSGPDLRRPATSAGGWREHVALLWEVQERDRWPAASWAAALTLAAGAGMAMRGLPAVSIHGPLHFYGVMDPLCGATRAVRLTLRGDLAGAWAHNPIGTPLTLLALLLVARLVVGCAGRRWVTPRVVMTRAARIVALIVLAALTIALEVNQQTHASLLILPR